MSFGEKAITRALAAFALLLLSACDQQSLMQKFASAEDRANARRVIEYLRTGKFDEIERTTDSSIKSSSLHDTLVRMAALMPQQEPTSVKLVGAQTMRGPNGTTRNLTFEYDFSWKLVRAERRFPRKDRCVHDRWTACLPANDVVGTTKSVSTVR
jgi:hypothetical protein